MGQRYAREFHRKWMRDGDTVDEPLLGSADLQSLADLRNGFLVVKDIKPMPRSMLDRKSATTSRSVFATLSMKGFSMLGEEPHSVPDRRAPADPERPQVTERDPPLGSRRPDARAATRARTLPHLAGELPCPTTPGSRSKCFSLRSLEIKPICMPSNRQTSCNGRQIGSLRPVEVTRFRRGLARR